jgi:hypothetical protein
MRPRGTVEIFHNGKLVCARRNLFVNAGLSCLANLIAGVAAGQFVAAVGFGSGATQPAPADTGLAAAPAYYNAVGAHSFPSAGAVQFDYALAADDYGANGITIQELGLFANPAALALPAAAGTPNPAWAAATSYAIGALIVDANGNLQRCAAAGESGAAAPAWATTIGAATSDGSATWTLVAMHTAPSPMIAHVVVPAFAYTGAGNYSGTWTLTF